MSRLENALERLRQTSGVTDCWILPEVDKPILLQLENESNSRQKLPGIFVENEGLPEVLNRHHIVAISHSPQLRHPPGPVIVLCDEKSVVGEEVGSSSRLKRLSADRNVILLGTSLVLYRDRLVKAKGKRLKLAYRALRFPELEKVDGIQDVISVTVGSAVHKWLTQRTGWSPNDLSMGTVLIGFNESTPKNGKDGEQKKA